MNRPPIVFVRHGETEWNREFRFQGQRDVPINVRGRRQAARNGRAVAGILAAGEWRLVASPLGRAVETMQILLGAAGQSGRNFTTDPVLMEANYGDWEGLTLEDVAALDPNAGRARDADKWDYTPPNGESYAMVAERVARWLATLDAPTFVVAHGGILRALLYLLAGLRTQAAPHFVVPHGRVILFTERSVVTI